MHPTVFFSAALLTLAAHAIAQSETIYLSNCQSRSGSGTIYYSEIDYYPAGSDSQNGEIPSSSNRCDTSGFPSKGYTTWEGNTVSCTFSSGVTATSKINSGAQQNPDYAYAGTVGNGYHTYNCYKDSQRTLYEIDDGEGVEACQSIYYCLP